MQVPRRRRHRHTELPRARVRKGRRRATESQLDDLRGRVYTTRIASSRGALPGPRRRAYAAGALLADHAGRRPRDSRRRRSADPLSADARGLARTALRAAEVSQHAETCGGERCAMGAEERSARDENGLVHSQAALRRASADLQHHPWPDEPRRAAAGEARVRRGPRPKDSLLPRASLREARAHGLGPAAVPVRRLGKGRARETALRSLLRQEPEFLARSHNPAANSRGRYLAERFPMTCCRIRK